MTTPNACVFLLLGGLMNLLPALAPGAFPPGLLDGANTSALWLRFMGWVNGLIGAGYAVRLGLLPLAVRALAWRPVLPPEMAPAQLLRPAVEFYEEVEEQLESASAVARPDPAT